MAHKTNISDFYFEFAGSGHYRVTYESPSTGRRWRALITDMTVIDATKNREQPKRKDLNELKTLVKWGDR